MNTTTGHIAPPTTEDGARDAMARALGWAGTESSADFLRDWLPGDDTAPWASVARAASLACQNWFLGARDRYPNWVAVLRLSVVQVEPLRGLLRWDAYLAPREAIKADERGEAILGGVDLAVRAGFFPVVVDFTDGRLARAEVVGMSTRETASA